MSIIDERDAPEWAASNRRESEKTPENMPDKSDRNKWSSGDGRQIEKKRKWFC